MNGTVTGYSSDTFEEVSDKNTIYDTPDTIGLTIVKSIDASDLYDAHGSPNFAFEISGTTAGGENRTFHTMIDFTGTLEQSGMAALSKTIQIPAGTYTIRELPSDRYVLTELSSDSAELTIEAVPAGPPQDTILPVSGYAYGTLTSDAQVTFSNRKTRWENYSHTSSVINHFSG